MNAKTAVVPETQSALWRVALSLDAFVVNGIPLGVIQGAVLPGFLEKVSGNLTRELDDLEKRAASHGLTDSAATPLTALRANCDALIRVVCELSGFRTLPLSLLHSAVQQVRDARADCVQTIQDLETQWGIAPEFYQSRPQATQAADDFLAGLEQTIADEWHAAHTANEVQPLR